MCVSVCVCEYVCVSVLACELEGKNQAISHLDWGKLDGWVWEGYAYLAANKALLSRCGMGRALEI